MSILGQGWPFLKTAVDGLECSSAIFFAALITTRREWRFYQGASLLGSYSTIFSKIPDSDIRTNPNMYTIEMRERGNTVRVYSGTSSALRFTAAISNRSGYAGIR